MIGRRPAVVAATNPFLPGPASRMQGEQDSDTTAQDDIAGEPVMFTGPSAPTGAPAPQAPVRSLLLDPPAVKQPAQGSFVVQLVGLHGGAGTSVLASAIGVTALDCGVGVAGIADQHVPVVFVTRAHGRGLDLALRAGQQWAARGLEAFTVLGLILVADAPGQTRGLAASTKSARGAFPGAGRWRGQKTYVIRRSYRPLVPPRRNCAGCVKAFCNKQTEPIPPAMATN